MTRSFNPQMRIKSDTLAALSVTLAPIIYFLPAILVGAVLCPDDGIMFNTPLRVATANIIRSGSLPLWNPYVFSGMPLFASSQGGLLFPPNWFYLLFSPPVATNLMVVSSYMIAALGAYVYMRRTGVSISGSLATSLIWQWSGFLIGQIGHINIVQTAAMLPWVLWAIEAYVETPSRRRGALLSIVVAIQIFVGHQQSFAYSAMLVISYVIVMSFRAATRRCFLYSLAYIAAGVILGAVQIVPTVELLRNSTRATADYSFITSFSLPKHFVMTFLAPYVMGGGDGRLFRAAYFGLPFYAELVGYVSVLAIMLAIVAALLDRNLRTKFWVVVVPAGLLLAFGSNAPFQLYRLIYFVPILNLFRVPARHLMEVQFALAVLAGRGLMALEAARGTTRAISRTAIVGVIVVLATFFTVTWWRPAQFRLAREASVTVLRAPELFMPILISAVSAAGLIIFARRRHGAPVFLLILLAIDLILWGQSSGSYMSPNKNDEIWHEPQIVKTLREFAPRDAASYRILTAPHTFDPAVPPIAPSVSHSTDWDLWIQPDVYMLFGIQNAAGYDGFGLERYSQLAGQMKLWGELTDPNATLRSNSREIDLLNARYLVSIRKRSDRPEADSSHRDVTLSTASAPPPATEKYDGFMFSQTDLSLPNIGPNKRVRFSVPAVETDHVALLTNLSWAEDVPDNAIVGRLRLRTKDGQIFEFPLRAGVDTADWAYDRPDIRARIRHKHPAVATSYEVSDAKYKYAGHTYVTSFALPGKVAIESGEVVLEEQTQWPNLLLTVFRVSLVNASEGKYYALAREMISVESTSTSRDSPQPHDGKGDRWKLLAQGRGVDIYENGRALPRAWLATSTRVLDEGTTLQVIRTGVLPDGTKWDPLQTALVEAEPANPLTSAAQDGHVEITTYEPSQINLQTHSGGASILVLSENAYPGWRAYIDGQSVDVLRVNYGLRGVLVPPGEHHVSFAYRPWSVMGGLLLSLLTVGALIGLSRGRKKVAAAPAQE
jgi:hypothetical protein